jgi:hypothetical protein
MSRHPIQRSTWKANSPKFAVTEFSKKFDTQERTAGVSFGVARPSSFGGEMNNERISQRLEHQVERINAKLESTRNPARRKQLRERMWALKSRLRGSS